MIVVHLAHENDRVTAIASIAYVIARMLHGLLYIGGVKGVRGIAFLAGVASVLVILSRLVT